jgi:general secretion pathway protein G
MRKECGFTLVEIMVVIVIIGILATVFLTQISGQADKARVDATKALIVVISGRLDLFKLNEGRYPDRLEDLVSKPAYARNWPKGGYLKEQQLKDAWGRDFIYNIPSRYEDEYYDLISYGADGQEGGEGDNEDIWNHDKWKKR